MSHTSLAPWALKNPMTPEQAEQIISAVARRSLAPGAQAWLQGDDPPANTTVLSSAYQQVVWVYRAINVLAEQVANIPHRRRHPRIPRRRQAPHAGLLPHRNRDQIRNQRNRIRRLA